MIKIKKIVLFLVLGLYFLIGASPAAGRKYDLTVAQVKYNGMWNPYPESILTLIKAVKKYTSIDVNPEIAVITARNTKLFSYPFLYLTGCQNFPVFLKKEVLRLRKFLINGGLLFVDNCSGTTGLTFHKGFKREMARIFPQNKIKRLKKDHAVYRSFFLLKNIGGRRIARPYFEGVTIGDWTPVIYTQNDFAGAWAQDALGKYKFGCEPGGERQRHLSIRSGINIILYALTVNYKLDQVHIPFILKRRR